MDEQSQTLFTATREEAEESHDRPRPRGTLHIKENRGIVHTYTLTRIHTYTHTHIHAYIHRDKAARCSFPTFAYRDKTFIQFNEAK